ncbi:hypothetical protein A0H81_00355 [Grifola frondosa]|uniref:Uncharacterized protein n=1 Tax=Grifola frondosa TaxID=5627 RepID=A0A1C7MS26_GRIFR|nr:hypothetical protein A0H81_00355 [Grifola frondosa]
MESLKTRSLFCQRAFAYTDDAFASWRSVLARRDSDIIDCVPSSAQRRVQLKTSLGLITPIPFASHSRELQFRSIGSPYSGSNLLVASARYCRSAAWASTTIIYFIALICPNADLAYHWIGLFMNLRPREHLSSCVKAQCSALLRQQAPGSSPR